MTNEPDRGNQAAGKNGQAVREVAREEQQEMRYRLFPDFGSNLVKDFLGSGPLQYPDNWRLFGSEANAVRPRLDVHGEYLLVPGWSKIKNETHTHFGNPMVGSIMQIGHALTVDVNLQLTGTERIHARFRPFDDKQLKPSVYRLYNRTSLPKKQFHADLTPDTLWFEGDLGEIFDFVDPKSRYPLDATIAFGLIPIYLQDTYLLWDEMLGVAISKNNINLPWVSNLNMMFFAGFNKIDAYIHRPDVFNDERDAFLLGGSAYIDWHDVYIEATAAYLRDKGHDAVDEYHLGLSVTKTIGLAGVTARILAKLGDESRYGNGQLYMLETNHPFMSDHMLYANVYYGTEGWTPISSRIKLRRFGMNFFECFCGMPPFMKNDGTDSMGGVLGVKFYFMNNTLHVNPEIGFLEDRSSLNNDQLAIGLEISKKITKNLFLMVEARWIKNSKFGNDYGITFPLTFKF